MPYKLGKKPHIPDPRDLSVKRYMLAGKLPPIPKQCLWGQAVPEWPMYQNDKIGDCIWAGAGHLIQCQTFNAGKGATPKDDTIIQCYEWVSGYNPADPSTDNGDTLRNVLNYWRKTGIDGHSIGAYVSVHKNLADIHAALWLFGGLYIGLQLPNSASDQTDKKQPWDVVDFSLQGDSEPGSWGGHCVILPDYSAASGPGYFGSITWGGVQLMTGSFLTTYCDEIYAVVSQDWINDHGLAPSGFNMAQLSADLKLVAG